MRKTHGWWWPMADGGTSNGRLVQNSQSNPTKQITPTSWTMRRGLVLSWFILFLSSLTHQFHSLIPAFPETWIKGNSCDPLPAVVYLLSFIISPSLSFSSSLSGLFISFVLISFYWLFTLCSFISHHRFPAISRDPPCQRIQNSHAATPNFRFYFRTTTRIVSDSSLE